MGDDIGPEAFVRQQTAMIARPDSRPTLAAIKCPTLVLTGDQDNTIPNTLSKEMADGIPGAKLVIIPIAAICRSRSSRRRPPTRWSNGCGARACSGSVMRERPRSGMPSSMNLERQNDAARRHQQRGQGRDGAKEERKLSTLRMVNSTIKNADIDARGQGKPPLSDADLLGVLQKMIKQRQESVELYDKGGRAELAAQEREEIAIISAYLPKQMSEDEVKAAIAAAIAETGAAGMKDMGKVIGAAARRNTPARWISARPAVW